MIKNISLWNYRKAVNCLRKLDVIISEAVEHARSVIESVLTCDNDNQFVGSIRREVEGEIRGPVCDGC